MKKPSRNRHPNQILKVTACSLKPSKAKRHPPRGASSSGTEDESTLRNAWPTALTLVESWESATQTDNFAAVGFASGGCVSAFETTARTDTTTPTQSKSSALCSSAM